MTARPLTIITTRLPPDTCGIGAHSWFLREHWPNESSKFEFLVMEDAPGTGVTPLGDKVRAFHGRGSELRRELDRLGSTDVLLHYAGRAYQRFGIPLWMPRALARWRQQHRDSRLTIFVHELPGEFPITSRHFWLGRLNARIIARLSAIADVLVTNTEHHVRKLREISAREDILLAPVSSNITHEVAPGPRSRTEFALFGLPFGRLQTLRLFQPHLRRWLATGRLTKLHLIGPHDEQFTSEADQLIRSLGNENAAVIHGTLPSGDVARILRRVGCALSNTSTETWSKSGTFMACAANHCPVVIASAPAHSGPFSFTVRAEEVEEISETEVAGRAAALADWYFKNADWPVIARRIASASARET